MKIVHVGYAKNTKNISDAVTNWLAPWNFGLQMMGSQHI